MEFVDVGFEIKSLDEKTGTFEGLASTFGEMDLGGDIIAQGAFDDTLKDWQRRKRLPPMLYQHHPDWMIGHFKSMTADDEGLHVQGKLTLDPAVPEALRAHALMKDGSLTDMSIGFMIAPGGVAEPRKGSQARRVIKKINLFEVSLVTLGMNQSAKIRPGSVKSYPKEIRTIRDFEEAIREVFGFSNAKAKLIASHGFKPSDPRDEDDGRNGIADALKRSIAILQPHS